MNDSNRSTPIEPNPNHQRQKVWQIYLPMTFASLVILALAVLAVVTAGPGNPKTGQWASISLIWMIAPWLMISLVFFVFLGLMIYGLSKLIHILPIYARLVNVRLMIINLGLLNILNRLAKPVMTVNGWSASWQAFWRIFKRQSS